MGRAANRSRTPRTGTTELCVLASLLERVRPRRPWNARLARLDTPPMSASLDAAARPTFAPNIVALGAGRPTFAPGIVAPVPGINPDASGLLLRAASPHRRP